MRFKKLIPILSSMLLFSVVANAMTIEEETELGRALKAQPPAPTVEAKRSPPKEAPLESTNLVGEHVLGKIVEKVLEALVGKAAGPAGVVIELLQPTETAESRYDEVAPPEPETGLNFGQEPSELPAEPNAGDEEGEDESPSELPAEPNAGGDEEGEDESPSELPAEPNAGGGEEGEDEGPPPREAPEPEAPPPREAPEPEGFPPPPREAPEPEAPPPREPPQHEPPQREPPQHEPPPREPPPREPPPREPNRGND